MTECHSFLTFLNLVVCPNVSVSQKNKIKKIQQISNFNSNQNINLQLALCIFLNLNIKAVSVYIRWIIWNYLSFESTPVHPRFLCGVCVAHLFVFFLCCPIMCPNIPSFVLWCPLRFPHKKGRMSYLCFCFGTCWCVVVFSSYCVMFFFFFFHLVYPMLPVSLIVLFDCPFGIL